MAAGQEGLRVPPRPGKPLAAGRAHGARQPEGCDGLHQPRDFSTGSERNDLWIDVKGNGYVTEGNKGIGTPVDGAGILNEQGDP
ncbi:hypothetical protein GCM10010411_65680 [Actinomadura fulvescens]|uniref:Uncharacterized protein n=2 Tax=Actinomadura fulvescens TaxID=46160 RepID=A0ABP6CN56_9ACTN